LTGLSSYRSTIGTGSRLGSVTITATSPPSALSDANIRTLLTASIGTILPLPSLDSQLYYFVVPQPGTSGGVAGLHSVFTVSFTHAHYGWITNNSDLDALTTIFSHELAEGVTDPEGNAVQVNPRSPTNWNEISDGEAQNYGYRLNGYRVQSFWSQVNGLFAVPIGHTQNLFISGGGSRILTINGDQLASHDDTITLDVSGGGVQVTFNGETATFDPGAISSIVINSGDGTDTINVLRTLTGMPVTINSTGTATVNVGNAGNAQGIAGTLTINNPSGSTALNIDDSADAIARTVTVQVNGTTGTITGLTPANIVYATTGVSSITLNGGSGGNTFNVLSTAGPVVNLNTGAGNDRVNLGSAANVLDDILADVNIDGQGGTNILTLNDQGNIASQTFTVAATSVTRSGIGLIGYNNVSSLTINGGNGGNIFTLLGTAAGTLVTLNPGGGTNILVGSDLDNTWTLTAINAGMLTGAAYGSAFPFAGFANLTGGAAGDTFLFSDGGGITGTVNSGGGTNTLDYSAYTANVLVNFQTSTATGVGGTIANFQNATGGAGANLLVGNGGNVLTGGTGRNILIAGAIASTLIGGNDDDILIGGTTIYDTDFVSLQALLAYWAGPDDNDTRVANLTSGSGVPLLDATTVTGNGGGNILTGGLGRDLFYGNATLDTTDWDPITETFVAI
jgi:hypothetical protein